MREKRKRAGDNFECNDIFGPELTETLHIGWNPLTSDVINSLLLEENVGLS